MKDVAYFMSSCFDESECERRESSLLDRYFEFLHKALERSGQAIDSRELEANWRELYPWHGPTFSAFFKAGAQAIGRLIGTVNGSRARF